MRQNQDIIRRVNQFLIQQDNPVIIFQPDDLLVADGAYAFVTYQNITLCFETESIHFPILTVIRGMRYHRQDDQALHSDHSGILGELYLQLKKKRIRLLKSNAIPVFFNVTDCIAAGELLIRQHKCVALNNKSGSLRGLNLQPSEIRQRLQLNETTQTFIFEDYLSIEQQYQQRQHQSAETVGCCVIS